MKRRERRVGEKEKKEGWEGQSSACRTNGEALKDSIRSESGEKSRQPRGQAEQAQNNKAERAKSKST